jgi:hypothetical protein
MLPENFRRIRQNNNYCHIWVKFSKVISGIRSWIWIFFYPGVIKAPDPGSRSTTLVLGCVGITNTKHETGDGKTD